MAGGGKVDSLCETMGWRMLLGGVEMPGEDLVFEGHPSGESFSQYSEEERKEESVRVGGGKMGQLWFMGMFKAFRVY